MCMRRLLLRLMCMRRSPLRPTLMSRSLLSPMSTLSPLPLLLLLPLLPLPTPMPPTPMLDSQLLPLPRLNKLEVLFVPYKTYVIHDAPPYLHTDEKSRQSQDTSYKNKYKDFKDF